MRRTARAARARYRRISDRLAKSYGYPSNFMMDLSAILRIACLNTEGGDVVRRAHQWLMGVYWVVDRPLHNMWFKEVPLTRRNMGRGK